MNSDRDKKAGQTSGTGDIRSADLQKTDAHGGAMHERLMVALKASRCGTWRWDIPTDTVEWDEALGHVYGIPPERTPKTSHEFFALIHTEDRERIGATLMNELKSGSELDYEFRAVIDGKTIWIQDRSMIVRDESDKALYVTGACLDVTERKMMEEERKAALEKQQLLLRELNHRIKNHLQMITALLGMQASRQPNAETKADFQNAIQRIQTIADLHVQLYSDDWLGEVNMKPYLEGICKSLHSAVVKSHIELECDIEPLMLPVDQALPLGLIVNELVTNAAKYAFAGSASGMILVRLRKGGDRVFLSVADNGCGMQADGGRGNKGIGQRVVQSLSRQIGARLRLPQAKGLSYHLAFRNNHKQQA